MRDYIQEALYEFDDERIILEKKKMDNRDDEFLVTVCNILIRVNEKEQEEFVKGLQN